jgi:Uma2 family endonuclease
MVVELKRRQFTIQQYRQMLTSGVLQEGDRVELIEGEILEMAAVGSRHTSQVKRLNRIFSTRIAPSILISVQDPIELGPRSEPQPDLALLRFQADFYQSAHPQAEDVYLLVEVADTTLEYDRTIKAPMYAQAGIREYWIVNLVDGLIEVYTQPHHQNYQQITRYRRGQTIAIQALPGLVFDVSEILG